MDYEFEAYLLVDSWNINDPQLPEIVSHLAEELAAADLSGVYVESVESTSRSSVGHSIAEVQNDYR